MLLGMLFEQGTYKKLYSYQHLLNGFAVHISHEQVKPWTQPLYMFLFNRTMFMCFVEIGFSYTDPFISRQKD